MTPEKQKEIADSFSENFEEFDLELVLSNTEFNLFDKGVFAESMDRKWNIFVIADFMYMVRSWTNYCIYKIHLKRQAEFVTLLKAFVTKDKTQYNSNDIHQDKIQLLQVIQMYLGRDDIYIDQEFNLELIRKTILQHDPNKECKKSIGHNTVGLTREIYNGLTTEDQKKYFDIIGWTDLKNKITQKSDKEPLLSPYMHNKKTNKATTYYFDQEANELLGQIIITGKVFLT